MAILRDWNPLRRALTRNIAPLPRPESRGKPVRSRGPLGFSGWALILFAAACASAFPFSAARTGTPSGANSTASFTSDDYRLGALDKLRVKVFEWRASRDEVFEWAALNAEYTIGASGKLSLPLIGEVPAAGLTTPELSQEIGDRLRERMGLAARPDASIEIVQFRPFYITGEVERPGEYPYRPGLTVLQALTISGGLQRNADSQFARLEREVIVSTGDLDSLAREANALIARKARLEAELKRANDITFAADLTKIKKDASVGLLMHQERLIFQARKEGLETQLAALNQLKVYLDGEVESLTGQLASHETLLRLVKEELSAVASLSEKGLTTAPRRLALERNVAQLDGDRMRLTTNLLKAKQDISRTDISILELHNKRVNEVTSELQQTQAKLEQVINRTETAEKLLYESEVIAPRYIGDRARSKSLRPTFTIYRPHLGKVVELKGSNEATLVQPGDTIKVDLPQSEQNLPALQGELPKTAPLRFSQELMRPGQN